MSCLSRPGDGEMPAKSDGSASQPSAVGPADTQREQGGDRVTRAAESIADRAQSRMGGSGRRTAPRHGPQLESNDAPGVRDDPPGDPAEVAGLDAAGLEDLAGPGEADLAAEAAVEGVVLDDLGELADVDGVEVDAGLEEEGKDGTDAAAPFSR